jgi:hypothetical protein
MNGFEWHTALTALHLMLPADAWGMVVKGLGYLTLLTQLPQLILNYGLPLATKAADWMANVALNSPARPLILWQAPRIVKGIDQTAEALDKLAATFKDRLEADLAAAQTPPTAPPPAA